MQPGAKVAATGGVPNGTRARSLLYSTTIVAKTAVLLLREYTHMDDVVNYLVQEIVQKNVYFIYFSISILT